MENGPCFTEESRLPDITGKGFLYGPAMDTTHTGPRCSLIARITERTDMLQNASVQIL